MDLPTADGKSRTWLAVLPLVAVFPAMLIAAVVIGASPTNPTCAQQSVAVFDGDLAQVLATIRTIESGNDYQARATGSSASGAYQFIDSSWAGYGGYDAAWQAPPSTQDAKAAEWATTILQNHGGDIAAVPVVWYIGHLPDPDSPDWGRVPYANAGNVLTPREYQTKWMNTYNNPPAADNGAAGATEGGPTCVGVVGTGDYRVPDGVDQLVASNISWGGYTNGNIPLSALRYSPNSNHLHPAASVAWDQLHAAALEAGHDLTGNGYRPASAGGATAGRSNHGWGLAIDINNLVVGNRYPTADAAFASPEYTWLAANAAFYGWINPSWAKPVDLGGNGTGGHIGNTCCYLEPWHWEWAAFLGFRRSE